MRSETVTRSNITLRKEAIYGIAHYTGQASETATILIYLIGGQTVTINLPNDQLETEVRAWKNSANL